MILLVWKWRIVWAVFVSSQHSVYAQITGSDMIIYVSIMVGDILWVLEGSGICSTSQVFWVIS